MDFSWGIKIVFDESLFDWTECCLNFWLSGTCVEFEKNWKEKFKFKFLIKFSKWLSTHNLVWSTKIWLLKLLGLKKIPKLNSKN